MDIIERIEQDLCLINDAQNFQRQKVYNSRHDPFQMNDTKFFSRYRFDKESVRYIINLVKNNLPKIKNNRGLPINHSLMVLVSLHFFARNTYQEDSGWYLEKYISKFILLQCLFLLLASLHGISQSSVSRIVKCVSRALALLLPLFIKFPESVEEISEAKNNFYSVASFPNVIGAIDCTHVRIKSPIKKLGTKLAGHYINRKQLYSINVQVRRY